MNGPVLDISPPEKLTAEHDILGFDSGEPVLDGWLRRRALANEDSGSSRTYVVCVQKSVVGYYALAVGAVAYVGTQGRVKRSTPDPVPVMVLGRLAVDKSCQGRGIGSGLLRDAVLRTIQAAEIVRIRYILVHAVSEAAIRFYQGYGFIPSPIDPMTVMITIAEARKMLGEKG